MIDFRAHFLDASAIVVREMHISASGVKGAIELLDGLDWPPSTVRLLILDMEGGREAHSEERRSVEVASA